MRTRECLVAAWVVLIPLCLGAQEKEGAEEHPAHDELRVLKAGVTAAFENWSMEQLDKSLGLFHEKFVFTPMNSEVCHGHEGLRAYFQKMLNGPNPVVKSVSITFTIDELADLYDEAGAVDAAVAYGNSVGQYELSSGLEFDVENRWTATLVKENGKWLIASLHGSANMFDNPLLNKAKGMLYWAGGTAGIIGLVVGLILSRVFKRKAK